MRFYTILQEETLLPEDSHRFVPCYWYPLKKVKENIPVLEFGSDYFADGAKLKQLRAIFIRHNIDRAIIIPELLDDYVEEKFLDRIMEQDEDGYTFPYYSEQYIYGENKDWMIYTSHEATITFAGEWLTEEINNNIL